MSCSESAAIVMSKSIDMWLSCVGCGYEQV